MVIVRKWSLVLSICVAASLVASESKAVSPLSLPPGNGQWAWYPIQGGSDDTSMICMDRSPTGIGISMPAVWNDRVLIWMAPGGVCDDATSCGTPGVVAHHSYSSGEFQADQTTTVGDYNCPNCGNSPAWPVAVLSRGIFDRSNPANPFAHYAFVFIPYCTGDLHQGHQHDSSSTVPGRSPSFAYHFGANNFTVASRYIGATFPAPLSIVLGGSSAGGAGAYFNYPTLRLTYSYLVPITVISDSSLPFWTGTPSSLIDPNAPWLRQGYWLQPGPNNTVLPALQPSYQEDSFADAWGLASTRSLLVLPYNPPGSQHAIYPQQNIYTNSVAMNVLVDKFGVIIGTDDLVIPQFLHLRTDTAWPNVAEGILDFTTNVVATHGNTRILAVSSTLLPPDPRFEPWYQHHVYCSDDVSWWGAPALGGSGLLDFLTNPLQLGILP
jgi:hypothetical protein